MANEHFRSMPLDVLFRCKSLTDVLALQDLRALHALADGWGCEQHDDYQAQAVALAQHAQAETSKRLRAWEREKLERGKLGKGKRED